MKLITKIVIATFAATWAVMASAQDYKHQGFLVQPAKDSRIVTSGFGECWRTGDWKPQDNVDSCGRPIAAAEPMPSPVVAAAEPPAPMPVHEKVSLSGDVLFAFDKSELKPEGIRTLDDLVQNLNGATTIDSIQITGHTDRFGSDEYNQQLSERRAQTVKNYLMSKNVRANRLDAEGKGEMQPVTKADDCQGPRSAKVIACLRPDRRVEIELTGTRLVTDSR